MNKPSIAIIDYQLSNLYSVQHACDHLGLKAKITSDSNEIKSADAAILPGVGAFGDAMENLNRLKISEEIINFISQGKAFMGVCLGLQLLFDESEEFGKHMGLGIIKGKVKKIPERNQENKTLKIPEMGWNQIFSPNENKYFWKKSPLVGVKNNSFMYFVHSYYVDPTNKDIVLSLTDYDGFEFCSAIKDRNVFAVQFHPEKSGQKGIEIYRHWADTII